MSVKGLRALEGSAGGLVDPHWPPSLAGEVTEPWGCQVGEQREGPDSTGDSVTLCLQLAVWAKGWEGDPLSGWGSPVA